MTIKILIDSQCSYHHQQQQQPNSAFRKAKQCFYKSCTRFVNVDSLTHIVLTNINNANLYQYSCVHTCLFSVEGMCHCFFNKMF